MAESETEFTGSGGHFRLCALPQELRNLIYEYAIEPRADFRLLCTDKNKSSTLPTMTFSEDTNPMATVLGFTLITFTPLLLVSKGVSTEVQDLLRRLRPIWHDIIESTIHSDRLVSPCPAFLNICSQSRFILHERIECTYQFLKGVPEWMSPYIHNVVITHQRGRGRSVLDAWDPCFGDNECVFMNVLLGSCNSLNTIALEVPSVIQGGQFIIRTATWFVLRLLADEVVSSVHFVQREMSEHNEVIFEKLEELSARLHRTLEAQPSEESLATEIVPRVFDVVEESGDSLIDWNNLGYKRALRVTRFAQAQLGTPTYTRRVGKN